MRKFTLEDGTEIEVPTDEEIAEFKAKAEVNEELQTKVTEFEAAKAEEEANPTNKNWKELRDSNKKLKEALKAEGKEISEDGAVKEQTESITMEEIQSESRKAARSELLDNRKSTLLKKFDDEQRKVVEHYYDKLSAGEELDIESVDKYIGEAEKLANPDTAGSNVKTTINNGVPNLIRDDKDSFANTPDGKRLADEMFGENSFNKVEKK